MTAGGRLPARVLMTADTVGGVWQYALQLAAALSRHGVSTMIAASGRAPSPGQRRAAAQVPGLVLEHRPYRLEWMSDCEDDLGRAGDWLTRLADGFQPDIVQINGYAAAALPWQAPVIVVCHSCVRTWWQSVHGCDAPLEWGAYVRRVCEGLAAADLVVAPSQAFLSMIEAIYGPLPPSEVIHNGCGPSGCAPARKQPLVFSAGRLWDAAKNTALLDAVAATLPWPVFLAGPVTEPVSGHEAIPLNARPLGELDSEGMAQWLASAAIFASPAKYEPFGLAVLEAALSGCALVLGDIPTLRELWTDAALFVDPSDAADLESAIVRLTDNPELRTVLGDAAARRARTYTAARMARGYLSAYARAQRLRAAPDMQPAIDARGGAPLAAGKGPGRIEVTP